MTNNDILRRLRFALKLKDSHAASLFSKNPHNAIKIDGAGFRARIAKEGEDDFVATTDPEIAAFLDGLIAERRGLREDAPALPKVERINKNEILQKLRIAFALRDEGMLKVLHRGGSKLTKSELSALFRKRGHKHYRECGNQVLRAFLTGLIDRPTDLESEEAVVDKAPKASAPRKPSGISNKTSKKDSSASKPKKKSKADPWKKQNTSKD